MRYLLAGLGNIGPEYHNTRHNIGFSILDRFAQKEGFVFEPSRYGDIGKKRIKNRVFFSIKPSTYMNNSGKAIRYWLNELKIPSENLLVVVDDLALPFGQIRLRSKGSDGGHNGLKSIIELVGSQDFNRLRFGIGDQFSKGRQVDYVLGEWDEDELKNLQNHIDRSLDAIKSFAFEGIGKAMTKFNTK